MASVRRWVLATAGICLAVAFAYLPPRGDVPAGRTSFFTAQLLQATPARQRAQALAEEWRAADGAVRLLEERAHVRRSLANGRSHVAMLRGDAMPVSAQRLVQATLDSAWRDLGLEATKVRVGLVIAQGQRPSVDSQPAPDQSGFSYLLPDSSDRTTCVALLSASPYWRQLLSGERPGAETRARLRPWLRAGLGPCAFYARYGTPGRQVRRWLSARAWDVASVLVLQEPESGRGAVFGFIEDQAAPWFWEQVYRFPPATIACLAGRESGCRAAVLMGADGPDERAGVPSVVRAERYWWRTHRLLPAGRYLSDVARTVGRERFQDFWTSRLPIDTALAASLKQPIGAWTVGWQGRFVAPIRLGPTPALGGIVIGLLLAITCVIGTAALAIRRQVR